MNLERLYKRRTWTVVALFAFAVLIYFGGTVDAVAPSTVGVAREFRLKYGDSVLVGDGNGRAYLYYKGGSTVGVGIELSLVTSKSVWRWANMDTGRVIMIYHYDDNRTVKCLDSLLIEGTSLPDTFLTRPESVADDVIRGYHIDEEDVWPQHMHPDSTYNIKIGATGDVNVNALPAAAVLESEWGTLFHDSFGDTLEAGNLDAVFDTCTVESLFQATRMKVDSVFVYDSTVTWMEAIDPDSIAYPSASIYGDGLMIYQGDIALDLDPSAGYATLIQEEGALQLKYYGTHFDETTNGLELGTDVVNSGILKDSNTPADEDIFTYESTGSTAEWHTPAELSLMLVTAFDDSLASQGFENADTTGGPLATRTWTEAQGYTAATAWDDIDDPDADATIAFAGYEQTISTTLDEAAHTVLTLNHTAADVTNQIYMMEISSVDNDDNSISYLRIIDDTGGTPDVLFEIDNGGNTTWIDGAVCGSLGDLYWFAVDTVWVMAQQDQTDYLQFTAVASEPKLEAVLDVGTKWALAADGRVVSIEDTLGLGTASAAEHMIIHNAGSVRIYDAGDDTSVLLGPVNNGTTVLDVTGTIDADGLQVGGVAVQTGTDDDVPEAGDFGAATDLDANGALLADVVAAAEMADADHGDFTWASGVASLDADVVAAAEMADADHGDITWASGAAGIDADAITEAMLKAVDSAADEEMLTYESTTGDFEWQAYDELTLEELEDYVGAMVTGNTETRITVTYQDGDGTLDFVVDDPTTTCLALADFADSIAVTASTELSDTADLLYEAELDAFSELQTQISDKVLVNTADATNMVLATVTGTVDAGGATSLEIPNAANPTTGVVGRIAIDSNDEAIEVYIDDQSEAALISFYDDRSAIIKDPEDYAGEQHFWTVDAMMFPHGIEIDKVAFQLDADAAYTLVFEEWSGDPPAAVNDIESVSTDGASDSYGEVTDGDIDDDTIAAGNMIYWHIPATDVGSVSPKIVFHALEGN